MLVGSENVEAVTQAPYQEKGPGEQNEGQTGGTQLQNVEVPPSLGTIVVDDFKNDVKQFKRSLNHFESVKKIVVETNRVIDTIEDDIPMGFDDWYDTKAAK